MSYTIGGVLCQNRAEAIATIVGDWFSCIPQKELATLDASHETQAMLNWMREDHNGRLEAEITGKRTIDGDPVYEDLAVTGEDLFDAITQAIEEARSDG